jgi:hypothetical protein
VCVQYNRMTEQQERLREAALASMKARSDALGDIATRDKLAAKKRAEDEDARLVCCVYRGSLHHFPHPASSLVTL